MRGFFGTTMNIENLEEIITEEQALSFLEQAVKGGKKAQEQQKKESDSFSVFSFSTASEFLTLLQKVVNPKILSVMGTPDLRGEYFTFSSPFKRP